jgi:hypothetical protein
MFFFIINNKKRSLLPFFFFFCIFFFLSIKKHEKEEKKNPFNIDIHLYCWDVVFHRATFVKQSHLDMPPPGWLLVNGVSLSTDVHQQTYDSKAKHIISSPPPMITPPNSVPFTATMNDRQYQKLENADSPKKIFIDRQIQKAKALPGLIKWENNKIISNRSFFFRGTALSRHSAPYTNPTDSNPLTNDNHEDSYQAVVVPDNDDDSSPIQQHREQTNEIRRPRVSFSDFNKVQFFEDSNENSQQSTHRRHRHRTSKKSNAVIASNHTSPPSIQHSQSLYTPYRPLSRQQPIGHELNIKKQQIIPSPRVQSSRIAHLPDILNQTLPTETSIHEKYVLQRERPLLRIPEPAVEVPINSSAEMSRESARAGGLRSSAVHDYNDHNSKFDLGDSGNSALLNSSSMSSSLTNRQRPPLRTISLRQQFMSPLKTKSTSISNNHQILTNTRRSVSLKQTIPHIHSIDDDHDDIHTNGLLSTYENRPMTGVTSSKQLRRNYIIHFNSKSPYNGNTPIDSNETNRHINKSSFHEPSEERFQNVLKVVRPPYISSISGTHHDSTLHQTTNHTNGSIRSSRTNSGHQSHEYHLTSNTIYV